MTRPLNSLILKWNAGIPEKADKTCATVNACNTVIYRTILGYVHLFTPEKHLKSGISSA